MDTGKLVGTALDGQIRKSPTFGWGNRLLGKNGDRIHSPSCGTGGLVRGRLTSTEVPERAVTGGGREGEASAS